MTLTQLKNYVVGVLRGWFANKSTLDKFSESQNGDLLFNGAAVGGGSTSYTDQQITDLITSTVAELNGSDDDNGESNQE